MAVFPAVFGLLLIGVVSGNFVEVTPPKEVRSVNEDVTMLCKVSYPIDSCRIVVGGLSYIVRPGTTEGDVVYHGRGFQEGECGANIRHIREEWNGNVTCQLPPQTGSIEVTGTMRLLVARAPGNPTLVGSNLPYYREGDLFNTQCVVPNGRPAAKLTWFLGDEQLLNNLHMSHLGPLTADDLQTIYQNVSWTLTAADDGKRLVCRAEHAALSRPVEASKQLNVQYPPKRLESGSITIFGLKLSTEGRLNVTVRANPPPHAEWTVAGQALVPPRSSDDGSATALDPIPLGNGYYNITLILNTLTKEDVDRTYYLRVTNDLGQEEFAVRISTMDEPAGVELEAGAIVGIVVGVLALLIAIFLVVFAKATDRWCFAGGRNRDHTKSSGESSDTESAVGGRPSRLAGLGARMRAALPRSKDKVQATETQEADKPLSEEKKGVVYAELALGDQTAEKPTPPATEYAEIVYTDQPPKETKE